MITVDMIEAKKVIFLKPICEEDFPEKGMTAWLTDVEWDSAHECYELYFDFSEFEDINDKYFKRVYRPNRYTAQTAQIDASGTRLYTAKEAGYYQSKYSVFLSAVVDNKCLNVRNDAAFAETIKQYLKEVE